MKKIVLHSCCGPCLSSVVNRLDADDLIVCWYNPNIEPEDEHNIRYETYKKLLGILDLKNLEIACNYETENKHWHDFIKGLEKEVEGGERCNKCIEFRLKKVAEYLGENDNMMTTLTVSPHKKSKDINEIGKNITAKYLASDFKKEDGYLLSLELSKKYDLYRQNYCGCIYSKRTS
jgi:predicted adenine nucleotide alpha hydrolase (AANH) superfamily ATPase